MPPTQLTLDEITLSAAAKMQLEHTVHELCGGLLGSQEADVEITETDEGGLLLEVASSECECKPKIRVGSADWELKSGK